MYFKKDLKDKEWHTGKINKNRNEPRSYNVESGDGIYRRNRLFIRSREFVNSNRNSAYHDHSDQRNNASMEIIPQPSITIQPSVQQGNNATSSAPANTTITTASGRVVKKPVKYGFDD